MLAVAFAYNKSYLAHSASQTFPQQRAVFEVLKG